MAFDVDGEVTTFVNISVQILELAFGCSGGSRFVSYEHHFVTDPIPSCSFSLTALVVHATVQQ